MPHGEGVEQDTRTSPAVSSPEEHANESDSKTGDDYSLDLPIGMCFLPCTKEEPPERVRQVVGNVKKQIINVIFGFFYKTYL